MKLSPASQGYRLVHRKKYSGCTSCMLACSLAHEGRSNPSLSRIQVFSDTFGRYLDRDGVEAWKTIFYELEGWKTATAWQTKATLKSLGLDIMAAELAGNGKLPLGGHRDAPSMA